MDKVNIKKMEELPGSAFNVVVAYGGPLRYALEKR
jgi:hypothetical protein